MDLNETQLKAIAIAKAKKAQNDALSADVQQRYAQSRLPAPIPEEPMADPLMISDTGVESTEAQRTGAIRSVFQGLSFGTADEAEAFLKSIVGEKSYSENIDQIRSEMKQYMQENPGQALTGEIIGGLMTPASLLKAPEAVARLGLWARGAVKGFAGGAAYGAGTAEGGLQDRASNALVSGGIGIVIGAPLERLIGTIGGLKGPATRQARAPTAESLKKLKDAAYKAVPEDQFALGPGQIKEVWNRSNAIAAKEQHISIPKGERGWVPSVVDEANLLFQNYFNKNQAMTLGQAEAVRRRLFKLAEDPKNGYIVRQFIDEFDDVLDEAMGTGTDVLKVAREANRRYQNVKLIEESFNKIDVKAGRKPEAYQKVAERILSNKNSQKFFKPEEIELLEQLANNAASDKVLKRLGKFEFSATGMVGALHVLALTKAPFLMLAYAGGAGARKVVDSKTQKQLQALIKEAGGIEAVRKASENPNQMTISLGGVTADRINQAMFGEE